MKNIIIIVLVLGLTLFCGCSRDGEVMMAGENTSTADYLTSAEQETMETTTQDESFVYVYVCGCVKQPGVYPLKPGVRICEALELAGGVTDDARPEALNQAEPVTDGQTIYVPSVEEAVEQNESEDGLVDLNKADKDMLMTLPGIGESKADIIIQYREEHGAFESIEELMNIPGIKEGVFNKIKNSIKV